MRWPSLRSELVGVHDAAQLQGEVAAVAGRQGEIGAAERGQDDRVRHLQAVLLAQPPAAFNPV